MLSPYVYRVRPVRIVDADTLVIDICLGFRLQLTGVTCRLLGINAYEVKGPERAKGLAAAKFLIELLDKMRSQAKDDFWLLARTHQLREDDNFGRYLLELEGMLDGRRVSINEELVKNGHAVHKDYFKGAHI